MAESIHTRAMTFNVDADSIEVRASEDGDGLTIAGYIARFGERTTINDWLGEYTEEIERGAFANTIASRGPGKIKMQFNHGNDPAFGSLPIGVWTTMREDRYGLWGEGRIHDTWHTIPIRAAIESEALDGMSFKFKVIRDDWTKAKRAGEIDHRKLREVAMFEAGVVVHQAYEGTTVGVRSAALDLYRRALGMHPADTSHRSADESDTIEDEETAVAPVGDTGHHRTEADPPVGITRQEMRLRALSLLGEPYDPDRGAP